MHGVTLDVGGRPGTICAEIVLSERGMTLLAVRQMSAWGTNSVIEVTCVFMQWQ